MMTSYYSLLHPHVTRELQAARAARGRTKRAVLWRHLERAHILSQPSARLHTRVHWVMLVIAARDLDLREAFGQILRIAVAGLGSAIGRYPLGNTGRARVPIALPMPIEPDLAHILDEVGAARRDSAPGSVAGAKE
jgi:hypothetical protein